MVSILKITDSTKTTQLIKSLEKKVDRYDETLEVLFPGFMMKYTMVFSQIYPSNYGKDVRQLTIF